MPFKPGNKLAKGRKEGSQNKDLAPIRDKFNQLMEGYTIQDMVKDLKAIKDPAERLRIIIGLSEFIIPKLQRKEVEKSVINKKVHVIEIGGETFEV